MLRPERFRCSNPQTRGYQTHTSHDIGFVGIVLADWDPRLSLAKELGATHTSNRKEVESIEGAIREICPVGVETALDTSGYPQMVMAMLHATSFMGRCVEAGACELEKFSMAMDLGQKTLYGVSMGWSKPKEFIPQLIEYYKEGKFPFDKLITKFPFSQINEAFKASDAGEIIKGVLVME